MKCGINQSTGGHYYRWPRLHLSITLFPQHPDKLEMSIAFFRFYRVFHFGE